MKGASWVVVDTETDGLANPIHVVEIAAQRMEGWDPVGDPFRVLLNHGVQIQPEVAAIHGYTTDYLRRHGMPPLAAHQAFRDYAGNCPLVAHNLSFDWNRSLAPEWQRLGLPEAGRRGFCGLMLARRLVRDLDSYRLEALKTCFNLPPSRAHRAGSDVQTLVSLFQSVYAERLARAGLDDFAAVAAFTRRTPLAKCLDVIEPEARKSSGAKPRTTRKKRQSQSVREFFGVCRGIVADGRITTAEVHVLSGWLEDAGGITEWPGSEIAECVERILEDGVVTKAEKAELKALIERIADYLDLTGQSVGASGLRPPSEADQWGEPAHRSGDERMWQLDRASNRQIKLLKFFGRYQGPLTKGQAAEAIDDLFAVPENERQWRDYVESTGDVGQESADLQPYSPRDVPAIAEVRPGGGTGRKKLVLGGLIALGALFAAIAIWRPNAAPALPPPTPPPVAPTSAPAVATSVPTLPAASPAPTVRTPPPTPAATPTTVAESRAAAVRKRPELAIAGSPLNREFLVEFERLRRAGDALLQDPRHPEIIADRVADAIVERAAKRRRQ